MIENSDDLETVRSKLAERFRFLLGRGDVVSPQHSQDLALGRPRASWHDEGLHLLDDLVAQGISVSEAARRVHLQLGDAHNVTVGHVRTLYYDARKRERAERLNRFYEYLIDGDIASAATAWFQLDIEQRQEVNSRWF